LTELMPMASFPPGFEPAANPTVSSGSLGQWADDGQGGRRPSN
jgi:hypothetical protein